MPAASRSISRVARGERTRGRGYEREAVRQGGTYRQGAVLTAKSLTKGKFYEMSILPDKISYLGFGRELGTVNKVFAIAGAVIVTTPRTRRRRLPKTAKKMSSCA